MNSDASHFRLGLFTAGALLLLTAMLAAFGLGHFFKPKIFLETYIDGTAQGIDTGSAVKFRGVTVGSVARTGFLYIEYPEAERKPTSNYVVIVMRIEKEILPGMFDEDIDELLRQSVEAGLRAQIEPQGITGINYIEIDYDDHQRDQELEVSWQPRHAYLPSAPGQLTSALDSINNIMRQLESINIKGISEEVMALLQSLNQTVEAADLAAVSNDARRMANTITEAVTELDTPELADDLEGLAAEARALVAEIQRSNDDLQSILANLEPASRLEPGEIRAILDNIETISVNFRVLSEELRRDPSRLIWSRRESGSGARREPASGSPNKR